MVRITTPARLRRELHPAGVSVYVFVAVELLAVAAMSAVAYLLKA